MYTYIVLETTLWPLLSGRLTLLARGGVESTQRFIKPAITQKIFPITPPKTSNVSSSFLMGLMMGKKFLLCSLVFHASFDG